MKENNNGNDTNVGSIENSIKEDIEILVAFNLAPSLKHISEDEFKDVQKAIKHILSDYKRMLEINEVLLKENEELKDFKKQVTDIESTNFIKYKNYIPIQTIEDKIEDLKMSGGSDGKDNTENTARELAIEVLQDILDESKGK